MGATKEQNEVSVEPIEGDEELITTVTFPVEAMRKWFEYDKDGMAGKLREMGFVEIPNQHGYLFYLDRGADVFGVAHMDTVVKHKVEGAFSVHKLESGAVAIRSPYGDDRMGIALMMECMNQYEFDIVITDMEEVGRSTMQFLHAWLQENLPNKKYNWGFQFDRRGYDAVTYMYRLPAWMKALRDSGFDANHGSSFSDISYAWKLECCCVNIGCGYHNAHNVKGYTVLNETALNMLNFADFYPKHRNTYFPHNQHPDSSAKGVAPRAKPAPKPAPKPVNKSSVRPKPMKTTYQPPLLPPPPPIQPKADDGDDERHRELCSLVLAKALIKDKTFCIEKYNMDTGRMSTFSYVQPIIYSGEWYAPLARSVKSHPFLKPRDAQPNMKYSAEMRTSCELCTENGESGGEKMHIDVDFKDSGNPIAVCTTCADALIPLGNEVHAVFCHRCQVAYDPFVMLVRSDSAQLSMSETQLIKVVDISIDFDQFDNKALCPRCL